MEKKFKASTDTVYALLTDPKWLEARSLAMGELSAMCKSQKTSKGTAVTMQRRVHRDLNAVIAKVINPDSAIEVVEHWSGSADKHTASYTFTIVGKPVTVTADIALEAAGKGCVYRIQHTAKVKVPLIGGVIEKFILSETEKACSAELDYLSTYLNQTK